MRAVAYDHVAEGPLQQCCKGHPNDIRMVGLADGSTSDGAVDEILADGTPCILIHINDSKPFERLLESCAANRTIVRFSSGRLPRRRPYGKARNVLNCVLPLATVQDRKRMQDILSTLHDQRNADEIRSGKIPPELRDVFAFIDPHTLRALFLLCQSLLMQHASGSSAAFCSESRPTQGVHPPQLSLRHNLALRGVFWRVLAIDATRASDTEYLKEQSLALRWVLCEELGIVGIPSKNEPSYSGPTLAANAPDLDTLVECIFTGKPEDEIDIPKVASAFTFLQSCVEGTA